jgi:DNA-binding CsgD family transcriptional regulator
VDQTAASQERLGYSSLAAALGLSLWVASGSLVLAILGGLGAHPVRRAVVGATLVAAIAGAVWQRECVGPALRAHSWLVVVIATVELALALIDDALGGPFFVVSVTSLGLAIVVSRASTVWIAVAMLTGGYLSVVAATTTVGDLKHEHQVGGVIGSVLMPVFVAVVLLSLRWLLVRTTVDSERALQAIRAGSRAIRPALNAAVHAERRLLPPPTPQRQPRLTPTEIWVVEGLARGDAPKQLAAERGIALATIRKHVANAKAKTGVRTQRQLATLPARLDWPYLDQADG